MRKFSRVISIYSLKEASWGNLIIYGSIISLVISMVVVGIRQSRDLWICALVKVDSTASFVAAQSNAGVALSFVMCTREVGGVSWSFSFLHLLA